MFLRFINPYFQNFCTALYFGNPAARVKVESLKLLELVLETWQGLAGSAELFHVEDLGRRLHLELSRAGRSASSTVLSQLIQTTATLCRLFPAQLADLAETLFPSFLRELRTKMSSSTEKLDLTLVEGYVIGELTIFWLMFWILTQHFDPDP